MGSDLFDTEFSTQLKPQLRSTLAETFLYLEGNHFSLSNGYDLYKAVYDVDARTLMLKNARQTGKTQSIANFIAIDSFSTPYIKSLYVSPSDTQTARFSHTKLSKVIQGSPVLRTLFTGTGVNNVYLKVARNGAEATLSYASDDPDRIRGVTSDRNYYDEIQDMDLMEVMTTVDSTLDSSPDPRKILSGTPKSIENPLEDMWMRSSQTEPLIRCHSCKIWNFPSKGNIGKKGFICKKCGRTLNVRDFIWKDFKDGAKIKGFHIPQIVLPIHTENPVKWSLLLDRMETWPEAKFNNEILAESDSKGTRYLAEEDLNACCRDYALSAYPDPKAHKDVSFVVAGVDHGGGGQDGISRTCLTILGVLPEMRYKVLYHKVYPIADPMAALEDIVNICNTFSVRLILGDNGEGALANGVLINKLGKHRAGRFRYGSFAKIIEINPTTGVHQLSKTDIIDNLFKDIKDGAFVFPREIDSKVLFDDIMNEFSEITHTGKKIYTHSANRPDDGLHSLVGAWIAARLLTRNLTFY
jgi:hypothetical protein